MNDYRRIIKECFGDMKITPEDIEEIMLGSDFRMKFFLFEKILSNSSKLLVDLSAFRREELQIMLERYTPPKHNHEYLMKRKNIAEVYFFDKPLTIEELQWTI